MHAVSGAAGLTIVRASDALARRSTSLRAGSEAAASVVAWELAARASYDAALLAGREALATLAFDVAEGVIGHAVRVDPSTLHALTSQALTRARGARRLLVCVHPDDVTDARRAVAAALSHDESVEWVEVAADPAVTRGCAAVETERGRVSADWSESLALARARWLSAPRAPSR